MSGLHKTEKPSNINKENKNSNKRAKRNQHTKQKRSNLRKLQLEQRQEDRLYEELDEVGPDPCIKGKLKYHSNKCYMDTIFQLLLTDAPENRLRTLFIDNLEQIIRDPEKLANIKSLATTIIKFVNNLDQEQILTTKSIVDQLKSVDSMKKYTTNEPNDTNEFLSTLLDTIAIDYSTYDQELTSYAKDIIKDKQDLQISGTTHINGHLPDINSKYNRIITISKRFKNSVLKLLQPAISIESLAIKNNTNISDLLCWQEETTLTEKEPLYQILTKDKWTYTAINKEGKLLSGRFINTSDNLNATIDFTQSPKLTLSSNLTLDQSNMNILYNGHIIATYGYKYKIDRYIIDDANILIIPLNRRKFGSNAINITSIIPNETLEINDSRLQLISIITYTDGGVGHYFGYYLCNGIWYQYNDLGPTILKIGHFHKLIADTNHNKFILKRSTTLIYNKIN